jgi:putative ABC transport system permease protein
MQIAFKDILRSKLRFGLLAGAVGLLIFLLLFLNTLSSTLLSQFVGAVEDGSSDVIVFSEGSQATFQASRIDPALLGQVEEVGGVADAAPIHELSSATTVDGESVAVSLWGIEVGSVGTPERIVEGRLPAAGEVLMDAGSDDLFAVGDTLTVAGVDLEVVGLADNATFAVTPTAYMPTETWAEVFTATFPQSPGIPVSVFGVEVADGADPAAVAADIQASVAGVEALDRQAAADATPGVSSISQSFGLIVGITFLIVVVVVGFFFQILTVQKLKSFAVLKAVGASNRSLAGAIASQIAVMVTLGVLVGAGLLAGAAAGTRDVFAISIDWGLVATVGVTVLASSLLVGLFSIRRVVSQDPAQAAMGGAR